MERGKSRKNTGLKAESLIKRGDLNCPIRMKLRICSSSLLFLALHYHPAIPMLVRSRCKEVEEEVLHERLIDTMQARQAASYQTFPISVTFQLLKVLLKTTELGLLPKVDAIFYSPFRSRHRFLPMQRPRYCIKTIEFTVPEQKVHCQCADWLRGY